MNSELLYHFWIQWNRHVSIIVNDQRIWQGPSGAVISSKLTPAVGNWLALDVENAAIIQAENDSFLLRDRLQFVPIVCGLLNRIIENFETSINYHKIMESIFGDTDREGASQFTAPALKCVDAINKIGHLVAVREALSSLPLPIFEEIYMYFANPADD